MAQRSTVDSATRRAGSQAIRSLLVAGWFAILTFPIMVIRVNTVTRTVQWRWMNAVGIIVATVVGSWLWRWALERRDRGRAARVRAESAGGTATASERSGPVARLAHAWRNRALRRVVGVVFGVVVAGFPFVSGMYQTNIVTTALLYVVLGLGLNIIIGLGGMLHLGYIAFYALGAYAYALLNYHFGLNFWFALPVGALIGGVASLLVGVPVLRLRGDYLAIVTLAFAEITRLVLENWNDLTFGTAGIRNIPRPALPGIRLLLPQTTVLTYFIMIAMVGLTIFVVNRLEKSRIGRQMLAMKEDVIACQAMGVNVAKVKLTALALGGVWAGLAGVTFAARTTFINPASFSVWESVIVLCTVVLGGMGSIPGVVFGALVLILVPEYLRAFAEFRMLLFGAVLVLMMVFRPGGFIQKKRQAYHVALESPADGEVRP